VKEKLVKYAKKFLPLVGIIILIYLIIKLDVEKIKDALLSIKPTYVLLSLSLTVPALLVRNYGWQLIQKEQKIKLGFFQSLRIFLIGSFYSIVTPGFLGNIMRVPYMKEKTGDPYGKLFVNITIEVILRTLAVFLLMLVGAFLVIGKFSQVFFIVLIVFIIYSLIMLYFIEKKRGEKFFNVLIKYFIPTKLRGDSYNFVNTFYSDFPKVNRLILPLILGILTWVIVLSQGYIIVLALGVSIPYFYFLLLYPIAYVAGYLPITIAGLGLRELTAVLLFSTLFGTSKAEILVIALLGFIITDVVVGFIGFIICLTEARDNPEKKKELLRFQ